MTNDHDLIRRGDAKNAVRLGDTVMTQHRRIDAIPAAQVAVKPLEWHSTTDGAGWDHGVTYADCPVFEKRFWAETPDKHAKIEAKRAARIGLGLTPTRPSLSPDVQAILLDPIAVYKNMLRGAIATPSVKSIVHLYEADQLRAALARLGGEE